MDSKPSYRAPALDKGLDILEILAKTVMPMTMSEISEKAGRSRGEIFRNIEQVLVMLLREHQHVTPTVGSAAGVRPPRRQDWTSVRPTWMCRTQSAVSP